MKFIRKIAALGRCSSIQSPKTKLNKTETLAEDRLVPTSVQHKNVFISFGQEVGLVEIDETLRRCNGALRQAEELTTGYRSAMHDFKRVS